jgi:hypothetical protein
MKRTQHSFVISLLTTIVVLGLCPICAPGQESTQRKDSTRPRLLVLTDIGGDPDDQQSLIRLMLYTNEFDVEGLVATASGVPGELENPIIRPDLIRQIVNAYGQVHASLAQHAGGYPAVEELLAKVKAGNPQRGLSFVGPDHDTEASRWIIDVVDRSDARPVNVTIWGGQTDLAQALWRIRNDRDAEQLALFVRKLRVYDIDDQDRLASWISANFPDLFYILSKAPPGADKRLGGYRGMYLGGDLSLTSKQWLDRHVRTEHGPLGALYPNATWTDPNPHVALKEGDTPSWFYFLPNGLSDPAHPEWGGWGGRFQRTGGNRYRDADDQVDDVQEARASVWRWRRAFQHDFQARIDWCSESPPNANHLPLAVIDGDDTHSILTRDLPLDATVRLSATASRDPDGHKLHYRWWIYAEPGRALMQPTLRDVTDAVLTVIAPSQMMQESTHLILEVTDDGTPPLTAYRRVILRVR